MIRFATVCTNSWSCEVNKAMCFQSFSALLKAVIDNKFKMPQISRNSLAVDYTYKGYKFTEEII